MVVTRAASSFYDFAPLDKRGQAFPLDATRNKVVLVVNTASKCSFTPQYEGFEQLYQRLQKKYGDDFIILGFPCNQFMQQEPDSDDSIQSFCQLNYGVTFPVLAKIDVNGSTANPLYKWLKQQKTGILGMKRISWNFTKFSIDRTGKVRRRWSPTTKPEKLENHLISLLEAK
ncbi:hypothetical protein VF21_05747 [Pseudogymnoascus sp. 05NY08]|nr:hypothetical protein VF21_05747 [Pseudogymnoascus sp. 05NY08]